MNRYVVLIMIFIGMIWPVSGQGELLTLDQAISIALENNFDINIARNTSEINKNNTGFGNAGLLPTLQFSNTYSWTNSDIQTELVSGINTESNNAISTAGNTKLELKSNLFSGGKNYQSYRKLQNISELSRLTSISVTENILVAVISSYYSVVLQTERLRIARFTLEISQSRLNRIKSKVEFGGTPEIDLLNAHVDMNSDSISVLDATLQLKNARRELNHILNRPIESDFNVDSQIILDFNDNREHWMKLAVENNIGIRSSQLKAQQSEMDAKIARASYFPNIYGTVSYSKSESESDFSEIHWQDNVGLSVGLNLSVDLFNGFRNKTQVENANIKFRSEIIQLKQHESNLQKDLLKAWSEWENEVFTLAVSRQSLETARINFNRSRELFDLGQISTTAFREAQLNLVKSENRVVTVQYSAKLAEVRLHKLSSQLIP